MTITPPIPPVLPTAQAAPVAAPSYTLATLSVPPQVAVLPIGLLLSGKVVNLDLQGNPILQTAQGQLTLKTPLLIKPGSEVMLRIDANTPEFRARILTIDGAAPQQPGVPQQGASQAVTLQGPVAQAAAWTVEDGIAPAPLLTRALVLSLPTLEEGGIVPNPFAPPSGVLQPAAQSSGVMQPGFMSAAVAPASPLAALVASLRPGQMLWVNVSPMVAAPSASSPGIVPQSSPAQGAPLAAPAPLVSAEGSQGVSQSLQYAAYGRAADGVKPLPAAPSIPPATAGPSQAQTVLPAGGLRVLPNAASATPAVMTFEAQVLGIEPGGAAILRTPAGILRVDLPQAPTVGQMLKLEILPANVPAPETEDARPPLGITSSVSEKWDTLDEVLEVLGTIGTGQARVLENGMPNIARKLAPDMMFFMQALKGGEVARWLGAPILQTLEREGRVDLVRRLGREFGALRATMQESAVMPWQMAMIPVYDGQQLQTARFFVRREAEEEAGTKGAKGKTTRFVVEVTFSELGPVQLDGFLQPRASRSRHCDLIVRSRVPLPIEARGEISRIYREVGEATGLQGSLEFSVMQEFPVQPLEEIRAAHVSRGITA